MHLLRCVEGTRCIWGSTARGWVHKLIISLEISQIVGSYSIEPAMALEVIGKSWDEQARIEKRPVQQRHKAAKLCRNSRGQSNSMRETQTGPHLAMWSNVSGVSSHHVPSCPFIAMLIMIGTDLAHLATFVGTVQAIVLQHGRRAKGNFTRWGRGLLSTGVVTRHILECFPVCYHL